MPSTMIHWQDSPQKRPYTPEAFSSELREICGSFHIKPSQPYAKNLHGHLSRVQCGPLELAYVGFDGECTFRDVADVRSDPGEHFFLVIQREGKNHISQGDWETMSNPGDLFLVDSAQPSVFRFAGSYSLHLSVHLPRNEMLLRFGPSMHGGLKIASHDPMGLAIKALLSKLISCTTPGAQAHMAEAFYSVLGAFLTDHASGKVSTMSADQCIVQRSMSIIAARYQDSSLTTRTIANTLGISLRRVQRAFKTVGETPRDRIQRYRIETARQSLLKNAQAPSRQTITALAYDHGFGDISTFYRLYRRHYGSAPGQAAQ